MLEIKTLFGDWREVTREIAERFYKTFEECATAIKYTDRQKYFNENHIRGGHVLLNGTVETNEEQERRIFLTYKKDLVSLSKNHDWLRFSTIEYVCSFPNINPYEMAVNLVKDGIAIVYDDSSISRDANKAKERKVKHLLEKEKINES